MDTLPIEIVVEMVNWLDIGSRILFSLINIKYNSITKRNYQKDSMNLNSHTLNKNWAILSLLNNNITDSDIKKHISKKISKKGIYVNLLFTHRLMTDKEFSELNSSSKELLSKIENKNYILEFNWMIEEVLYKACCIPSNECIIFLNMTDSFGLLEKNTIFVRDIQFVAFKIMEAIFYSPITREEFSLSFA